MVATPLASLLPSTRLTADQSEGLPTPQGSPRKRNDGLVSPLARFQTGSILRDSLIQIAQLISGNETQQNVSQKNTSKTPGWGGTNRPHRCVSALILWVAFRKLWLSHFSPSAARNKEANAEITLPFRLFDDHKRLMVAQERCKSRYWGREANICKDMQRAPTAKSVPGNS